MATTTTNLNLVKPAGSEDADVSIINSNMDILDTAVHGKADTTDLATVATTGVYADLTGKPSIPDSPDDIGAQPVDTDLTAISALTPTNDDVIQRKAGAWTNRTPAQLKTDLALGNVDNTADTAKPVSTAQQTALNLKLDTSTAPELIRDTMGTALVAGTNVTITPNDGSDTITIVSSTPVKPHPPVTLTDAATVATDASLGTHFRVTIAGNRSLGAPTNPTDGQVCVWEVTASGSTRTLDLSTAGVFQFNDDLVYMYPTISLLSGETDYIQAVYRTSVNKWRIIGHQAGY